MFRRFTLFLLFSATAATLLLPTTCDVNFSTSSMLLGQNHSKIVNKVGDLFMACVGRKKFLLKLYTDCSRPHRSLAETSVINRSVATHQNCNGSRACIINATSQGFISPVSTPDLKSPPPRSPLQSSPPYTRRSRSISLPPGSAPAPAPELMFFGGSGNFGDSDGTYSSHDDQVNWIIIIIIIIIVGVVSVVVGGCVFIFCCFRRKSSTRLVKFSVVIGGCVSIFRCFRQYSTRLVKFSVVIGVCVSIFRCFRQYSIRLVKFRFTRNNDSNIEAFLRNQGAIAQKRYKFSEVKKMTNSFKVKLGQGGFGTVYEGKLQTGSPVAVKLLKASKRNGEEFINEVASISRTSHVNIVTLVGFCLEGSKKALIYEFMANGSLDKFIYNRGPENIVSLTWENLYQIAIGIARGLEYLHRGCNTKILHFDIKPHNILLDENFCPKISDFGLAKLCPRNESIISMSDKRGTMGYYAPEMVNRHFGGVSQKSDVYSYGMMLLEMVGGRKNINPEASHTSEIYFPHFAYRRLDVDIDVDNDVRPYEVMNAEEGEIAKRMTVVGLWCIQSLPSDRPTMSRVVEMLEGNMNSLEMPPKPLFSSPSRSET
ncbi:PR5-like receptor kinase [Vigna angularis]|nr:PR5-like receptor kinase [Vigna angularis]